MNAHQIIKEADNVKSGIEEMGADSFYLPYNDLYESVNKDYIVLGGTYHSF